MHNSRDQSSQQPQILPPYALIIILSNSTATVMLQGQLIQYSTQIKGVNAITINVLKHNANRTLARLKLTTEAYMQQINSDKIF